MRDSEIETFLQDLDNNSFTASSTPCLNEDIPFDLEAQGPTDGSRVRAFREHLLLFRTMGDLRRFLSGENVAEKFNVTDEDEKMVLRALNQNRTTLLHGKRESSESGTLPSMK